MAVIEYDEYKQKLQALEPTLGELEKALGIPKAREELAELQKETEQEGFWNDLERSQQVSRQVKRLENKIKKHDKLVSEWEDTLTLCEMAQEEDDPSQLEEVVSGMRFGEFLRKEFFEPLDMVDTGFYVPEGKRNRLVTAYKRTENGLVPWTSTHLAVGVYDREPAFESGGAGLVSTLEDYSHFADMLLAGGTYEGRRILSPATVACMTQPQLKDAVRRDMWDSLDGYSYGHLMRICAEPGRIAGLACAGEYGWDGWLGTYFANFPGQQMTILSMQNTVDSGTTRVVRQMRNAVLAALSREN